MDNKQLAKNIVDYIGGADNITQNWHCITRLRFNVKDAKKVNIEEIRNLNGVMGAQFQGAQFQVIIGGEVANVFEEVNRITENSINGEAQSDGGSGGNIVSKLFDVISSIFNPILPAIIGSGLIGGFLSILTVTNVLAEESQTYMVLYAIYNATFYFLPFLVAYSASKKFKASPSLSLALAGVLLYPTFINNAVPGTWVLWKFLGGIPLAINNYSSSVIPIILTILLLKYVEKLLKKIIPKALTIVFVPMLALLITAPIMLILIAPLGFLIGTGLATFFTWLFTVAGPIAGALMGGLMPLIVITGMHYAFFPGTLAGLEQFGYDLVLLPMNIVANLAQAGAVLAVFFKTKDEKMKQLAFSSFIPAPFGITEPAIYGVTMKLKKPFYASMIGGAVGGAIYGTFAVKTFQFTIPGVLALPTYIETGTSNLLFAIIGVLASFVVGFVMTMIFKFDTGKTVVEVAASGEAATEGSEQIKNISTMIQQEPDHIIAPITGKVISLSECPDQTFASGLLGKGVAIIPDNGKVYSPVDGTVVTVTPTNHAIGLLSDSGVEILIHIGIDTVSLQGEGFKRLVEEGARIKKGDLLFTFDIDLIKANQLDLCSPVTITNTSDFLDVVPAAIADTEVQAGQDEILIVIR